MSSDDELRNHIKLLPPLFVDGSEVALEIQVHGAWVDGTYCLPTERTPPVVMAMQLLTELVLQHRQRQQEGRG